MIGLTGIDDDRLDTSRAVWDDSFERAHGTRVYVSICSAETSSGELAHKPQNSVDTISVIQVEGRSSLGTEGS